MSAYDAFISYSQAKDKPIAAALQSVVQTLGKPWYKRRALRIFRDDTSLSATPQMWPTLETALAESRFLILLASPESAHSQWVGKEISYWLEHKSVNTLLIAMTGGELTWQGDDFVWSDATPLPPVLKGKFPAVPKWVDLRAYRTGASKRDPKFAELGADFAAAIRGVPKEDLLSEEVRQQRRALTLAWSAAAGLLVLGIFAAWQWKVALDDKRYAVAQQQIAEQQRNRAEQTLDAATQSANGLVSNLAIKFRDVRGVPLEVIQTILQSGESLLNNLLSFNDSSPAIQLIRVTTGSELGFTLAQGNDPNGGKLATQAYQSAKQLYQTNPDLDGIDYAMGRAAEVMGQLNEQDNAQTAYNYYKEANDALGKCLTKNSKDLNCLYHEFTVLGRIGNVLSDGKQYSDAISTYQQSLTLAQQYAQLVPPGPDVAGAIGGRYNHLGQAYLTEGDNKTAMADFTEAQKAMEPYANDLRAPASFVLELSNAYNNISQVLALQANAAGNRNTMQQAVSYALKSVAALETLAAGDPSNAFYWTDLSIDYYNLAQMYGALGDRGDQQAYANKTQDAQAHAKAGAGAGGQSTSSQQ